jgi:hypothetical protein
MSPARSLALVFDDAQLARKTIEVGASFPDFGANRNQRSQRRHLAPLSCDTEEHRVVLSGESGETGLNGERKVGFVPEIDNDDREATRSKQRIRGSPGFLLVRGADHR